MTHVSKRKLKKKDFDTLYKRMVKVLSLTNTENGSLFFNEFFSSAEKIMFTKRLCAILMFEEQYSVYRVSETLYISPSTALRIRLQYEAGAYVHILSVIKKNAPRVDIWNVLERILQAGMPPRGKGRWRYVLTDKR